ncbi:phage tail protein [uncultured Acinetobacter sp.]|uniref:phage tail protein n=1 Tax=uncultured Acinetobacter sp. TaxID=165433 RepID=UPI0025889548|nr:phage tail protein [uncultured Acinetobacter sp.]
MTAKYYVTLTDYGATQVAQAHDVASITLTQMVIGDANGVPYDPIDQKSRTSLVHQRATVPVQSVVINGAVTTVTATLPANIGGFNLHEIGLKDNTGQLIYIGNYHGGYKPVIAEGAGGELTIVIDITAESGKAALIEIDPNVVTANKDWVIAQINALSTSLNNLTQQLNNNKYDKTGGIISGNVTINGSLKFSSFNLTGENGYIPLGNGFIYQFGYIALSDMTVIDLSNDGQFERYAVIDLPTPFLTKAINPNAVVKATNTGYLSDLFAQVVNPTKTQITVKTCTIQGNNNSDGIDGVYWSVLGH